jgi:ApaG protein
MPTAHITCHVVAQYLPGQSKPTEGLYAFAYHVTIRNTGSVPAQVIARHWIITDADGERTEVKGLGVIGQQPLLQPGEEYTYASGTHLPTASGKMHGTYLCVTEEGEPFQATIPEFVLSWEHDRGSDDETPRVLH